MTAQAEECGCDKNILEKIAVDYLESGEPFLVWNQGESDGLEYLPTSCSESCYYRSMAFASELKKCSGSEGLVAAAFASKMSLDLLANTKGVMRPSDSEIISQLREVQKLPKEWKSPWVPKVVAIAGGLLAMYLLYKAGKGIYQFVKGTAEPSPSEECNLTTLASPPSENPPARETESFGLSLYNWFCVRPELQAALEKQEKIYDDYLQENAVLLNEDKTLMTETVEKLKCPRFKELINKTLTSVKAKELLEPSPEEYKDRYFAEGNTYNHKEPSGKASHGIRVKLPLAINKGPMTAQAKVVVRTAQMASEFLNLLDSNICFLYISGKYKDNDRTVTNLPIRCFGIAGRWVVLLKHYVTKLNSLQSPSIIYVNSCGTQNLALGGHYASWRYRELDNSEVCFLELPRTVNNFRDIRGHVMTAGEAKYLRSTLGIYEKVLGQPGKVYERRCKLEKDIYFKDQNGVNMCIPAGFTYGWQAPGRCMSPLVQTFNRPKIVGFHICGGDGNGAGEPIVFESLNFIDKELTPASPDPSLTTEMTRTAIDGNFSPVGVVKPHLAARPAEKTQIIPSEIAGYVPPKTAPAPLSPQDTGHKFSPLYEGIKPHGRCPLPFPPALLQRAVSWLKESYITNALPARSEVGVLGYQEAVIGIPGLDGYEAMEMSTSEGFPYTALRSPQDTNKRYLFDIEERDDGRSLLKMHPFVCAAMEVKMQQRRAGVIPCTVFTDCLKDARIKLAKLPIPGKTRIFSISPVDFTIQFRQYFSDILASQKVNRFSLNHSVGINVKSLEWTRLARHIQSKGSNIICGDYSNFGPTLPPDVVYYVGQVWCDWYEHYERAQSVPDSEIMERRIIRECMFEEMRHAVHLVQDVLYRAPCGSPSGAPPTVNINNDVNKVLIMMAWLDCWKDEPVMCSPVAFMHHCVLFVYGDDLVLNLSDYAFTRFHNGFIQSFMAEYGIKYTDAQKGDTIRLGVTLPEADFLKGKFIQSETHPQFFNYALDQDSLEDIANWIKRGGDPIEATKVAVYESLEYAYGWGKQYFTMHRERLLAALREVDIQDVVLYTFEELDANRFEYTDKNPGVPLEVAITKEHELREKYKQARLEAEKLNSA